MSLLFLEVTSISGFVPNEPTSLVFSVNPQFRYHLNLESGEIFQHPKYSKMLGQEDKAIPGQLNVRDDRQRGQEGTTTAIRGALSYLAGVKAVRFPEESSDP